MSKTLLTIGTSPRIGVATAIRFARESYRIVYVAGDPAQGEADVARIRAASPGTEVLLATAELADPVQVADLLMCFAHEVDVLQYHAAEAMPEHDREAPGFPAGAQGPDAIDEDICRHVSAVLAAVHAVLPMMRMRGSGSILLATSTAVPDATRMTLSIGHAAVRVMVQALSAPLRGKGVRIAAVDVQAGGDGEAPDADAIAERFWALHAMPAAQWGTLALAKAASDSTTAGSA